jgi:hypothetical protein
MPTALSESHTADPIAGGGPLGATGANVHA